VTNDEICELFLHHYGHLHQLCMMEEECAELIQACTKVSRGMSIRNLIEEIGDVENMIMQMKYDIKHVYKANIDWEENRSKKLNSLVDAVKFVEKIKEARENEGENVCLSKERER